MKKIIKFLGRFILAFGALLVLAVVTFHLFYGILNVRAKKTPFRSTCFE
jgi:succinate dehydrogenase/fumarate reductase cytochrome b subunit